MKTSLSSWLHSRPDPTGAQPIEVTRVAASRGIFTLANDVVFDSALALFESLRTFASSIPVFVIPYDERQDRLAKAVRAYGYDYFNSSVTDRLHDLGRAFYPDQDFAARGFRKLAAFEGPFEHFLFLDSDVIALSPVSELLDAFLASRCDLLHFDTDISQVYRPGPLRDRAAALGAAGFNAGLFAGRRNALTAGALEECLRGLPADWTRELVPNAEQPFLNFFFDSAGLRSLSAHSLLPDYCSTCWPAVGRISCEGGAYRLRDSNRWDEGWRLFFAHWAGFPLGPAMPNWGIFADFHRRASAYLEHEIPRSQGD